MLATLVSHKLSTRPLESSLCPYEISGIFYPLKTSVLPSFFKEHVFIEGILKTKNKRYSLRLLKTPHFEKIDHVSRLHLLIEPSSDYLKVSILSVDVLKGRPWILRYRTKIQEVLKSTLSSSLHPEASDLLYALLTGQIENKLLKIKFSDHGLSHILALSGFHLNLIFSFCLFGFKNFFRFRCGEFLGLICLSLFVLFTGSQSSIMRAYFMSVLAFFHKRHSLQIDTLHTLSTALILSTLMDPSSLLSPGFILSYAATASLCIFGNLWSQFVARIGPASNLWETFIYQWMRLFMTQAFIFFTTLPLILYFFHKIHLGSIFFNLIYPWLLGFFMTIGSLCGILGFLNMSLGKECLNLLYRIYDPLLSGLDKPQTQEWGLIALSPSLFFPVFSLIFLLLCIFWGISKKKQVI